MQRLLFMVFKKKPYEHQDEPGRTDQIFIQAIYVHIHTAIKLLVLCRSNIIIA